MTAGWQTTPREECIEQVLVITRYFWDSNPECTMTNAEKDQNLVSFRGVMEQADLEKLRIMTRSFLIHYVDAMRSAEHG